MSDKPVFKINMAIPSENLDFSKSSNFIRWSGFNDVREVVWKSQADAAFKSLKKSGNKNPSKEEIKIEKRKLFKGKYQESKAKVLGETWKSANVYHEADGSAIFPDIPTESKDGEIPHKIKVLATFFYRIVARTPYDENYFYGYTKNPPVTLTGFYHANIKKPNGRIDRSVIGKYRYVTRKVYHTSDSDSVKKDWRLRIVSYPGRKVSYINVRDLMEEGFEFESISDTAEIEKLANIIYGITEDFEEATPVNTNSRVVQLEYGKYQKKDSKKEIPTEGPNRLHGTINGYSVQAPRGFIRITEEELDQMNLLMRKGLNIDGYDMPQSTVFHNSEYLIGLDLEALLGNRGFNLYYLFDEGNLVRTGKKRIKRDITAEIPRKRIDEIENFITKGFQQCIISAKSNPVISKPSKKDSKKKDDFLLGVDTEGIKFTKRFKGAMDKASKNPAFVCDGWVKAGGIERAAYIRMLANGKPEMFIDMSKSGYSGDFVNVFTKEVIEELTVEYINELIKNFKVD